MGQLENKVAIVTGGSRGLGQAIVDLFLAEGARVATCTTNAPEAEAAAVQLNEKNGGAGFLRFYTADMGDPKSMRRFVEEAVEECGQPDIVVNNAAVVQMNHAAEATLDTFEESVNVNLRGYWLLAKSVYPIMKRRGGGAIVNIASTHPYQTREASFPYNITKGAILTLSRALALDFGRDNIRVNAVLPGILDTRPTREWVSTFDDADAKWKSIVNSHALLRMPTVEEVAKVVLFLASDNASGVSGAELIVDAGRHIKQQE